MAAFDHRTDSPVRVQEQQAAGNAVLVLDGIFLHRPELRHNWDFSIFLHVGFDVSVARCARRDGTASDPFAESNRRYVEGQLRYLRDARPWEYATVIVDNTDSAARAIKPSNLVRFD